MERLQVGPGEHAGRQPGRLGGEDRRARLGPVVPTPGPGCGPVRERGLVWFPLDPLEGSCARFPIPKPKLPSIHLCRRLELASQPLLPPRHLAGAARCVSQPAVWTGYEVSFLAASAGMPESVVLNRGGSRGRGGVLQSPSPGNPAPCHPTSTPTPRFDSRCPSSKLHRRLQVILDR